MALSPISADADRLRFVQEMERTSQLLYLDRQAPRVNTIPTPELNFSRLDYQVQRHLDYGSCVLVRWRLEDLRGEVIISEEEIYRVRYPEDYIRDLCQAHVRRLWPRYCQTRYERVAPIREDYFYDRYVQGTFTQAQIVPTPEAIKKAEELLFKFLTPKQRQTFETNKYFDVEVPKHFGKRQGKYRLYAKRTYNIQHLKSDAYFCAIPENASSLPIGDVLLTQKLMLETAPEEFLEKANTRGDPFYTAISSPLSITTNHAYTGYCLINNTLT